VLHVVHEEDEVISKPRLKIVRSVDYFRSSIQLPNDILANNYHRPKFFQISNYFTLNLKCVFTNVVASFKCISSSAVCM
jgi:hypothetical protein